MFDLISLLIGSGLTATVGAGTALLNDLLQRRRDTVARDLASRTAKDERLRRLYTEALAGADALILAHGLLRAGQVDQFNALMSTKADTFKTLAELSLESDALDVLEKLLQVEHAFVACLAQVANAAQQHREEPASVAQDAAVLLAQMQDASLELKRAARSHLESRALVPKKRTAT